MDNIQIVGLLILYSILTFASILLFNKGKNKINTLIFSFILASFLSFTAYLFTPYQNYDLSRHQELVEIYEKYDLTDLRKHFNESSLEPIPKVYSYAISKTGNIRLLQYFVVLFGYFIIFYLVADYCKQKKVDIPNFIIIIVLAIFGQSILYFYSGLYNYLAINIFVFAAYTDYIQKKNKKALLLYILSMLIHTSMLFPVAILFLLKISNNKINKINIGLIIVGILTVTTIVPLLVDSLGIKALEPVAKMLEAYTERDALFHRFYRGIGLIIDIIKIALSVIICIIHRKHKKDSAISSYVLLLIIAILIMLPKAIVVIRFASLAFYISIILLIDLNGNEYKKSKLFFITMALFAGICATYGLHSILPNIWNEKEEKFTILLEDNRNIRYQ